MLDILNNPEIWMTRAGWNDFLGADVEDVLRVVEPYISTGAGLSGAMMPYLWLVLPFEYNGQKQVFRVGPRMRKSISVPALDIPAEAVRPPYEMFYVELGRDGELLVSESPRIRGIGVRWSVLDDLTPEGNIAVLQVMWVYDEGSKGFCTVPARPGETWDEALNENFEKGLINSDFPDHRATSVPRPLTPKWKAVASEVIRTVIGLGLYAGGREPDIEAEVQAPDKRVTKLRRQLAKYRPGSRNYERAAKKLARHETRLKISRHHISPVGERVLQRWQRPTRAVVLVRSFWRRYHVGQGRTRVEWRHIAEHGRGSGSLEAIVRRYKAIFES